MKQHSVAITLAFLGLSCFAPALQVAPGTEAEEPLAHAKLSSGERLIVVEGNEQTRTVDCHDNDVELRGSGNRVTLRGKCRRVAVKGDRNTVTVDATLAIDNAGNNNDFKWKDVIKGQPPKISTRGTSNNFEKSGA